jgi:hypothetical protein
MKARVNEIVLEHSELFDEAHLSLLDLIEAQEHDDCIASKE